MLDKTVGNYCKDDGAEHSWEMYTQHGKLLIDCRCGAKAAESIISHSVDLARMPVKIDFPGLACGDGGAEWVEVRPYL